MSASDPKRTVLLRAIRKRSLPVIGSRGYLLPALRTATPPCCAVGGPSPQRLRRVRGRTRTKSGSRMALQVLGCDADVSLRPAGIPYQFQCAEIAPRLVQFEKLTKEFLAEIGARTPDKTRFLVWR